MLYYLFYVIFSSPARKKGPKAEAVKLWFGLRTFEGVFRGCWHKYSYFLSISVARNRENCSWFCGIESAFGRDTRHCIFTFLMCHTSLPSHVHFPSVFAKWSFCGKSQCRKLYLYTHFYMYFFFCVHVVHVSFLKGALWDKIPPWSSTLSLSFWRSHDISLRIFSRSGRGSAWLRKHDSCNY